MQQLKQLRSSLVCRLRPAEPRFSFYKTKASTINDYAKLALNLSFHRPSLQMTTSSRITIDPQMCGGRPCIRNMRIRVKDILDLLASGASTAEILEDYPYLESEDITASLTYAAHSIDHPVLSVA